MRTTRRMPTRNEARKTAALQEEAPVEALAGKKRRALKDISNAHEEMTKRPHNGGNGDLPMKTKGRTDSEVSAAPTDISHAIVSVPPRRRSVRLRRDQPIYKRPANYFTVGSYQYSREPNDIDSRDAEDPNNVAEYVADMYESFLERESLAFVGLYLHDQPHINAGMRATLVDWIIEVNWKCQMRPETLYLAVNIIDRFLASKIVLQKELQGVGITSLMIAAKYEEIYPMDLDELLRFCDNAYTRREILDMEFAILETLEYKITIPTAHAFLKRFLKAANADKKMVRVTCMILDGTLLSSALLEYLPSQLAAASIAIMRNSAGRYTWSPTLLKYTRYCQEEIIPVADAIFAARESLPPHLTTIRKKYSSSRFGKVANEVIVNMN